MWPGQTRFESHQWPFIFCFFFYFLVCKASSILSHSQFPRNPAKLRHESVKYRDYLFFSRPRRGPLRHVCGHTNHCTTIVHTFFKSPTDLDMHPWKRFAVFGQNRRNWRLRSGHPKQQNLLFGLWNYLPSSYVFYIYFISLHFVGTRGITYAWAT